ncbi:MAG: nicotinate-nucleotide--dimethylbenzimidazole phosphoribosyltransferase [Alphaproteobacteria bacterium]|nr:nicotinate-nucleotide--dimethylbenzimidazole phosphoribosyltransferase [Alphaproteobacteria bacterium]
MEARIDAVPDLKEAGAFTAWVRAAPGPDAAAAATVLAREATLTKPAGALGRLESLSAWMAAWQGRARPSVKRIHVAVFAGNHGVVARGVSPFPAAVTAQMVANFAAGGAAINQICASVGATLAVHAMAGLRPTADFTEGAAMTTAECLAAISAGAAAVPADADLLCLGEMGIGNTTAAAALCHARYGGAAADWCGPGTGLDAAGVARKAAVVAAAVACNAGAAGDGLALLAALGGHELAAIAGALVAARHARVPVLLDGFACTAAAAALTARDAGALDHCRFAHRSAEPGHRRLLEKLGAEPLLTLEMRLGEATGAALAAALVKAAVACHTGMATFAEAGVSGRA